MQKIIDKKYSLSKVFTQKTIKRWFTNNSRNSMPTQKVINELESLILSNNSLVEDYIKWFLNIIDRLDMAKSLLIPVHWICFFIKEITDPMYQLVVLKIRDMLTNRSDITI